MFTFLGCDRLKELIDPLNGLKDGIVLRADNSIIDQNEYEQLFKIAQKTPLFTQNDSLENDVTLRKYIDEYLQAKKLSNVVVWKLEVPKMPFNVNFFMENSASMNGYMTGVTDFETSVYRLLSELQTLALHDSLNLFFINNTIPLAKKDVNDDGISDYIKLLEPVTFRTAGGSTASTDLKTILRTVLNGDMDKSVAGVDQNNVSILVSDFIFSPGPKVPAGVYVKLLSDDIKLQFANKLQSTDLSVIILHMSSQFDGYYYDMNDKPSLFVGSRPYYIWFIGNSEHIATIIESNILGSFREGYLNKYTLRIHKQESALDYKINYNPRVGQFKLEDSAKEISNAIPAGKDFMFQVEVDLSGLDLDPSYLLDPSNYSLDKQHYSIKITELNGNPNYTHALELSTNDFKPEPLTVEIFSRVPRWVVEYSTLDDTNTSPTSDLATKTFGLYPLIEGVHEAFYPVTSKQTIISLTIPIK